MTSQGARALGATLTERVIAVADNAGLGGWRSSNRATADSGSSSLMFILGIGAPVLAAQVAIPVGIFGWQIAFADDSPALGWAMLALSSLLVVGAIIAAVVLCAHGARLRRRGRLMIHLYDGGFVLERTRGRVAAARYDEVSAELIVFENFSDNDRRRWDEHAVSLTLPDASAAIVHAPREPGFAVGLAEACGAAGAHRMSVGEFVDLHEGNAWGVTRDRIAG